MTWIPFLYVLIATVFSVVWMGLALGALLTKMGMDRRRAWIPVLRHVAAAEAGRVSRLPVLIARSVSTFGITVLLIALGLRGIQGDAISVPVAVMTLVGAVLFWLGALVGWIFWIVGAGTIAMRLNIARTWTILAALSPQLWAAIVGWANIGTPIPSDAIGRAASAGASSAAAPESASPVAASPVTGATSVFGAGAPTPEPGVAAFDTRPFAPAPAPTPAAAPASTPAPAAVRSGGQPGEFPAGSVQNGASGGKVAEYAAGAHTEQVARAVEPARPPVTPPLPASGAGEPAVPPLPAPGAGAPAPTGAPVDLAPPVPVNRDAPLAPPPGVYGTPHATAPVTSELPTTELPPQPPATDPSRPVSPYISSAVPQFPSAPVGAANGVEGLAPEPEDDETVIEQAEPPVAPTPPPAPESTPAVSDEALDAGAAAAKLAMLPPGWDGSTSEPTAIADPPPPLAPEPLTVPEQPEQPVEPGLTEATKQPVVPEPALDPTPPPARPAPTGVWAAPASAAPEPVVPVAAPVAASTNSTDDGDDFTVVAQRHRELWVLQVDGGDAYPLPDGEVSIGRSAAQPQGAGHLGIADATRTMSKRHATLRLSDGVWLVSDLGSTNGTFVRSTDGAEVEVAPGTEAVVEGVLLLGDLEARIVNQGSARG